MVSRSLFVDQTEKLRNMFIDFPRSVGLCASAAGSLAKNYTFTAANSRSLIKMQGGSPNALLKRAAELATLHKQIDNVARAPESCYKNKVAGIT